MYNPIGSHLCSNENVMLEIANNDLSGIIDRLPASM